MENKLPWLGWIDKKGNSRLSTWTCESRDVILVGQDDPTKDLSSTAKIYEVPDGVDSFSLAKEMNGIVVIIMNIKERFLSIPNG